MTSNIPSEWAVLAAQIPDAVLDRIRTAHEQEHVLNECAAHSEGQACCIDWLVNESAETVRDT